MRIGLVKDGWPYICGSLAVGIILAGVGGLLNSPALVSGGAAVGFILFGFMAYFFRDPERVPVVAEGDFVSGADGLVRAVEVIQEDKYLKTETVRISVFLSPLNVHVNRTPMAGRVTDLAYAPGKHVLTLNNEASEVNEHSSILIVGDRTRCLVRQIVGPLVRRVVYWLKIDQSLALGDRIGLMKFGSRLDMYFPKSDVTIKVKKGDRVRAGLTVVASLKND